MLGPDLLRRPRLSRIFYANKFFDYPLRAMNALSGLGIFTAFQVALSRPQPYFRKRRQRLWNLNRQPALRSVDDSGVGSAKASLAVLPGNTQPILVHREALIVP